MTSDLVRATPQSRPNGPIGFVYLCVNLMSFCCFFFALKYELTPERRTLSFSRGLPNNCGFSLLTFGVLRDLAHLKDAGKHCSKHSSDLTPVISMSKKKKKEKAKLINQGPEHSCLTLVQSREQAGGSGMNQISRRGGSREEQRGSLVF